MLSRHAIIEESFDVTRDDGIYHILVKNAGEKELVFNKGCTLGTIEIGCQIVGALKEGVAPEPVTNKEDGPQQLDASSIEIALMSVDEQFRPGMRKLLTDYAYLFKKGDRLGCTSVIKHHINTQGRGPIRLRPYRTARRYEEDLQRQIQTLLDLDVIEYSVSPWAAPVVLVMKKDGTLRLCIDFRKLNDITLKDSFPLPRIDDTLNKLNGAKFFTTLDLESGYWQIELDEASKEKTAFIVEDNLFQFKRMAMGLCNAPATFQRTMNFVLRDVLGKKALVYLDDIIIYSKTWEDHLRDLREVFALLKKANFKLKLKKCQFLRQEVNYLGHIITQDGIAPDPQKIQKIKDYPVPTSADEVRSFLGLAGYYRRFIPNFGKVAKSLTQKTQKAALKEPFQWTEEDQKAFEYLRTCLITQPILAYPDFQTEFLLFTDACNYGIGAVLSQVQNGKEVVISYFSRQLQKSETNYPTIEKEALAVVEAIRHFKYYLLDRPFTVLSDHAPLQSLKTFKDTVTRIRV